MKNIAHIFTKDGRRIYVPVDSFWARNRRDKLGIPESVLQQYETLRHSILKRWKPHPAFATFSERAHIAALRPHLNCANFALLDLQDFYGNVTRTKISRALESIGLPRPICFHIAGQSTVRQNNKYVLPISFRQSSLLATLVLDQSLFGSFMRRRQYGAIITIFDDDILLSSDRFDELERDYRAVSSLLEQAHFPINTGKSQSPGREITVFNIRMAQRHLRFTDERMWRFVKRASAMLSKLSPDDVVWVYETFFGKYVKSVNAGQELELRKALGLGSEYASGEGRLADLKVGGKS
jgi:hypothetical protein